MKFFIPEVGEIEVRKSHRAKRIILAITSEGTARMTVPARVPMVMAKQYAIKHRDWINAHTTAQPNAHLSEGMKIGRNHCIKFAFGEKIASRVSESTIKITHPNHMASSDELVQKEAAKAAKRAIRREAEAYLPKRLHEIASGFGYHYKTVQCKALKTRWGSCTSAGSINLNIWLMQLPNELVDYVLAHELTHLNHQHHQASFWAELAEMVPDYKAKRKTLKNYRPALLIQP